MCRLVCLNFTALLPVDTNWFLVRASCPVAVRSVAKDKEDLYLEKVHQVTTEVRTLEATPAPEGSEGTALRLLLVFLFRCLFLLLLHVVFAVNILGPHY